MQIQRKNQPKRFKGNSKKKSYGIGGAVMTLGKNLLQGKKFGDGMFKGVLKAGVTPGSGVGAGLGLAGALAGKSKNPALQKLGTGLDMAGNVAGMFTGGGGGGALQGLAGKFAGGGGGAGFQNIMQTLGKGAGGGGMKNVLGSLIGNTVAADGMKVYASGGSIPRMKVLKSMEHGGTHDGEDGAADVEDSSASGYDWSTIPTQTIQEGNLDGFEPVPQGYIDRNITTTEEGRSPGAAAGEEGFQQAQNPSNVGAFNLTTGSGEKFNPETSSLDSDLSKEQKKSILDSEFGSTHLSGEGSLDDQYRAYTAEVNNYFEERGDEKMLEEVKQNIANDPEYAKHFKNVKEADFVKIAKDKATDKLIGPAHGSLYTQKKSEPRVMRFTTDSFETNTGNPWQTGMSHQDFLDGKKPNDSSFIVSVGNRGIHPKDLMTYYSSAKANNIDVQKNTPESRDFINSFMDKVGRSIVPGTRNGAYNGIFIEFTKKIQNLRKAASYRGDVHGQRLSMAEYMEKYPDRVFNPNIQYGEPLEGQGDDKDQIMSEMAEEGRAPFMDEYFKSKGIDPVNATNTEFRQAEIAYERNPDMFKDVLQQASGGRVKLMKKGGKSYRGGGALSALMR